MGLIIMGGMYLCFHCMSLFWICNDSKLLLAPYIYIYISSWITGNCVEEYNTKKDLTFFKKCVEVFYYIKTIKL